MKLSSGSFVVSKELNRVHDYFSSYKTLVDHISIERLEDYEIELDDDLDNQMAENDEFAIYFFAKYEGDKSLVVDVKVCRLSNPDYLVLKCVRIAKYESDDDEYEDTVKLPISRFSDNIEFGVFFTEVSEGTKIEYKSYVYPSASFKLKALLWFSNLVGNLTGRDDIEKWRDLVENHA